VETFEYLFTFAEILSSPKVVGIHKITGAAFPGRKAAGA
jgi:hypothetical protein